MKISAKAEKKVNSQDIKIYETEFINPNTAKVNTEERIQEIQ